MGIPPMKVKETNEPLPKIFKVYLKSSDFTKNQNFHWVLEDH